MNNDIRNFSMGLDEISLILERGIRGNQIFLYFRNGYFYIQISDIRCFKFSIRRAKNSLCIGTIDEVKKIFVKFIDNFTVEKQNDNLFYLNVNYPHKNNNNISIGYKIKLKEINNFLNVLNVDNADTIIKKQDQKILSLLEKIKVYEDKYKETNTDDEMFIIY